MEQRGVEEADVLEFVAHTLGVKRSKLSMSTTLFGDLGVDGDDADEFFKEFSDKFNVDISQLDFSKHFGGEGFWPWQIPGMLFWGLAELLGCRFAGGEERVGLVPITIGELVRAARTRHW